MEKDKKGDYKLIINPLNQPAALGLDLKKPINRDKYPSKIHYIHL